MKKTCAFLGVILMLAGFAAQAALVTQSQTGSLFDANTWGGTAVEAGNTYQNAGVNDLIITNSGTFAGTLDIRRRLGFGGVKGARTLTMGGDLVLTAGQVVNDEWKDYDFTINLGGNDLVLNGGAFVPWVGDILIGSGALTGSATTQIRSTTTEKAVVIGSDVDTTGFTGVFELTSTAATGVGHLDLAAIAVADASFGLNVTTKGFYRNTEDVALTSLTLDGVEMAAGTYEYTDFTAAQQALIGNGGGTITVIPEPAVLGMIGLGGALTLLVRRIFC